MLHPHICRTDSVSLPNGPVELLREDEEADDEIVFRQIRYLLISSWYLVDMHFFVTKDRRFGVANAGFVPGDHLCIFNAASIAHIVRKHNEASAREDETWLLMGEAFVHGLMNGEIDEMSIEEHEIVLE
jgi:hypothetical protein